MTRNCCPFIFYPAFSQIKTDGSSHGGQSTESQESKEARRLEALPVVAVANDPVRGSCHAEAQDPAVHLQHFTLFRLLPFALQTRKYVYLSTLQV